MSDTQYVSREFYEEQGDLTKLALIAVVAGASTARLPLESMSEWKERTTFGKLVLLVRLPLELVISLVSLAMVVLYGILASVGYAINRLTEAWPHLVYGEGEQ